MEFQNGPHKKGNSGVSCLNRVPGLFLESSTEMGILESSFWTPCRESFV